MCQADREPSPSSLSRLQQAEPDQLLRDEGIQKPAVEGAEDYLGPVHAIGDACHLGMPRQVAISLISAGSAASA
jgi:hypothetical protein